MNPLILAILFSVFFTILHSLVDYLNLRHARSSSVPDGFDFSREKYAESVEYLSAQTKFKIFQHSTTTLFLVVFLWWGGFGWVDQMVRQFSSSYLWVGLFYVAILGLCSEIISLPFSFYSTFVLEEKFGFNRATMATFLADRLKGWLLLALLGAPLLLVLLWFFASFGENAWIAGWIFWTGFQLLLGFLAPVLLLPLFNTFTPLSEGPLREAIFDYAQKTSFRVQGIFTMDGSKRSTKANAFFTGLGRFRRIVLFDTLVEKYSTKELVAVLAHEVGHFKLGHLWKSLILSSLYSFLIFLFFGFVLKNPEWVRALGFSSVSIHASLTLAVLLMAPLSFFGSILNQFVSRKHEFEADQFAAKTTGDGGALVTALKRLSTESLSNLNPHPWKVILDYSHPPLVQRLRALGG